MISVRPFVASDMLDIALQSYQADRVVDRSTLALDLLRAGQCWTVTESGGRVLMIASVVRLFDHHGMMQAYLAEPIGAAMVPLTRVVRRWMRALPYDRLTAWIDAEHEEGARWAVVLGLRFEGHLPRFLADGRDCLHYGWVREEIE